MDLLTLILFSIAIYLNINVGWSERKIGDIVNSTIMNALLWFAILILLTFFNMPNGPVFYIGALIIVITPLISRCAQYL